MTFYLQEKLYFSKYDLLPVLYLDNVKYKYCDFLHGVGGKATLPWGFNLRNNVWLCPEISYGCFPDKQKDVILALKTFSLKRNRESKAKVQ